ncbi:hypothetical protein HKD37_15G043716 [Glycine soja]
MNMAYKKRKASYTPTQARYDKSRFTSQEAWERYTYIAVPKKLLPERNVVVYYTEFDEFKEELERRHWDEELTDFADSNIDIAIVKEFYANLYDPEDKSPKQVKVRGHLVKFDEDTLITFLKTPVILEEGENLCTYSRFTLLRPDPQELAAKLCIPRRGYELNADGQPLKILRKNMSTLAQTWSVFSFSNLIPTSHTSYVTLNRDKLIYGIMMKMDMNVGYLISHQISLTTQHDTSRLGFLALITAICKARGVQSDSRSLESLSPTINLAYIKRNCWNLDDPTVTFRGPRKARGKRSEVPTTSAPPETTTPSSSIAPSLQGLGLPSIMSMDEFDAQVAWTRAQPSSSRGGGASVAQEPIPEEPAAATSEGEDELTPPEPFYFDSGEEETSTDQIPEPSLAPIPDDVIPSAPASELEQPIPQDSPAAQVLDLNEHAQEQPQELIVKECIDRIPWAKRTSTAKCNFGMLNALEESGKASISRSCAKHEISALSANSRAHHSAYFGKRALEAARGAAFLEIPSLVQQKGSEDEAQFKLV